MPIENKNEEIIRNGIYITKKEMMIHNIDITLVDESGIILDKIYVHLTDDGELVSFKTNV